MDWVTFSGILNIVLTLVAVFQWWDRRSKNRSIENFISATILITERLGKLNPKTMGQKSKDICTNLLAIRKTVQGKLLDEEK